MPDHIHLITDPARKPSDTLRFINGIVARRVIDHLKEKNFESSLKKLERESKDGDHKYSLWEHHSNTYLITTEPGLMQKVRYIHQNRLWRVCARGRRSINFRARVTGCERRWWKMSR